MKKFLIIIFLAIIVYISYEQIPAVRHLLSYSPCNTPLTYQIGSVDSRFGLTTNDVKNNVAEAASIWNNDLNKTLFTYNPQGKITINLVYDQRQKLSTELNQLQKQITSDKSNLDPQIADYNTRSKEFDQKAADLNQRIKYWNTQGGAPSDVYNQLIAEQKQLQSEADQLNTLARSLKQSTKSYNSQIGELNKTEDKFQQTLTLKPEEGLWNGGNNTISIYFNNTKAELIHTLAHELGHARGMDHNSNPLSIMYPSSTEIITASSEDLTEIRNICRERSDVELIVKGYANLLQQFERKFAPAS